MNVLWEYPPLGSALRARALNRNINDTCVMATVQVSNVNANKPPGYSDYGSNSTANFAKRVADHLEYQGFTRGRGNGPGGNYGGAFTPLNWGSSAYHIAFRNDLDTVGGGTCGTYSLYMANALAGGVGTLAQWTLDAWAAIKTECDSRGLCYPWVCHIDFEDRSAVQFQVRNDDVVPADLNGCWTETIADARYTTEVLASLPSNKTLTQLVADQPAQTLTATNWYFFGLDNQAWSKLVFAPIEERVHDHSLHTLLAPAIAASTPLMKWGNYLLQMATDSTYPVRDRSNSWFYWYQSPSQTMHATMQFPRCYGPAIIGQSYDPANNATHGLGTTNQSVWRNFTVGQARACLASGVATMPCIEVPNSTSTDASGQYTPTIEDTLYLVGTATNLGVNDWLWFNPSMTEQQATDTLAVINALGGSAIQQAGRYRRRSKAAFIRKRRAA